MNARASTASRSVIEVLIACAVPAYTASVGRNALRKKSMRKYSEDVDGHEG